MANPEKGKMSSEERKIQEAVNEAFQKDPELAGWKTKFHNFPTYSCICGPETTEIQVGIVKNNLYGGSYQYHIYLAVGKYELSVVDLIKKTLREKFSAESGEVRVSVEVIKDKQILGTISKL